MKTIKLYNTPNGWVARYDDPEIIKLMGTDTLPTAFAEDASPMEVGLNLKLPNKIGKKGDKMRIYNINFETKKTDFGWGVFYKTARIGKHYKNKKQAISEAKSLLISKGKAETLKAINFYNKKIHFNRFISKIKPLFKKIFGFSYPIDRYSVFTGKQVIDVIYFDKKIETPDGVSTYDHVKKQYGNMAYRLITKTI